MDILFIYIASLILAVTQLFLVKEIKKFRDKLNQLICSYNKQIEESSKPEYQNKTNVKDNLLQNRKDFEHWVISSGVTNNLRPVFLARADAFQQGDKLTYCESFTRNLFAAYQAGAAQSSDLTHVKAE